MSFKNVLMKTGLVVSLAALAACASSNNSDLGNDVVSKEVVKPVAKAKPQGPQPGSAGDFEQNVGNRVFFGYDQYALSANAQDQLKRQAAWLKEYPEVRIRVAGNCDERGTREYNLALGARRANAAKAFLASQGVDPARITTISYGKERPLATGSNESSWAKNRNATSVLLVAGS